MKVWCVWTEEGDYEQHSRDLRGIFRSQMVATAHAEQLRDYDKVEVVEGHVLETVPVAVPAVRYSAHILPNGTEDKRLGYHKGSEYQAWSNELEPLDSARVSPWRRPDQPDRYIEVIGSDERLVAAEYERLLAGCRASGAATFAVPERS